MERVDALAVLGHPYELEVVAGDELGQPVGNAFVDLDLQDAEVGVDDEAILGVDREIEVTITSAHSGVEGDA